LLLPTLEHALDRYIAEAGFSSGESSSTPGAAADELVGA
jgi:hypothetical protein